MDSIFNIEFTKNPLSNVGSPDLRVTSAIQKFLTEISGINNVPKTLVRFDPKYINRKYWKVNNYGYLTNTWALLYITTSNIEATQNETSFKEKVKAVYSEAPDANTEALVERYNNLSNSLINTFEEGGVKNSVLLDNVSINISRTPTIVENFVSGYGESVKQWFGNNSYDININGLFEGPFFWQQDSLAIRSFLDIINSGQTIYIANPELSIIYDIDQIAVFNYNLNQDSTAYNLKQFTISCKSDSDDDIIVKEE